MDPMKTRYLLLWIALSSAIELVVPVQSQGCTYPVNWVGGQWTDNLGHSSFTFTSNQMDNFDVTFEGSIVSTWLCHLKNGELILSRSASPVDVAGDSFYLYICMLTNKVSNDVYYYHLMTDKNYNAATSVVSAGLRLTAPSTSIPVTDLCTVCAQDPAALTPPLLVSEVYIMTKDQSPADPSRISNPVLGRNPCDTTPGSPTTTTTTAMTTTLTSSTPTTMTSSSTPTTMTSSTPTTTTSTTSTILTTTTTTTTQTSWTTVGRGSKNGVGAISGGQMTAMILTGLIIMAF